MSIGSQNIKVTFSTDGSQLASYIDSITSKSRKLTQEAISGAIAQSDKSKEQLRLITEQIAALEKKSRVENQAARSIAVFRRDERLKANTDTFEGRLNDAFADRSLKEEELKERITSIIGQKAEGDQKIKSDYRENLTSIREQERQSKLQTQLAKENIDVIRQTARDNVRAIVNGDKSLADVMKSASTDEERLIARLTSEGLPSTEEESDGDGERPGKKRGRSTGGSVFGSVSAIDNINKLVASFGQFTQTQNGFDLIQPASNMAGRIIGGIIGGVIGSIIEPGVGTMAGAGVGASLGGGFGDSIGALEQRKAISYENFKKARFRYSAITGEDVDNMRLPDLGEAGVNATQYLQSQSEWARRMGYAEGSSTMTKNAFYADKGYGVDQGTSAAIAEMFRSSRSNNKDLAELIGGVLDKGRGNIFKNGDTTFLNEFLGKFTTLQKELLKGQSEVHAGTAMDIFNRFNKLGGEWDAKDPRSLGNINAIQQGLTNPNGDNLKAMSFAVLRRQNPNAGVFDLLEEQQKGLGSPGYLKGMLGILDQLGGDDQNRMLQLSGMFPSLSKSAVRRLYTNRQQLAEGSISISDLKGKYPDEFKERAERNTTPLEKNAASIENGILSGQAIDAMARAFATAIQNAMAGSVITLNNGQGSITILPKGSSGITKNTTKSPYVATGNVVEDIKTNLTLQNIFGGGLIIPH